MKAPNYLERRRWHGARHRQAGGGGERIDAARHGDDPSTPGRPSAGRTAGAAASHAPQAIDEPTTITPLRTRS